ncbi:MAG: helix-turn-helix transcriptional regulator [Candidatus Heimdallarchaeota archaeon]|nr:helix-turn-helix transcriptional regulator [Candidatus Heimdallarchaeota archaeon]
MGKNEKSTNRKFTNRIKVYRAEFDLRQEDLADKLNVSRQTINAIERGKYAPTLELAFKLAELFNVSIHDIFQLVENDK